MGRHEKAPARCPCSRLAALHGAFLLLLLLLFILNINDITACAKHFCMPFLLMIRASSMKIMT